MVSLTSHSPHFFCRVQQYLPSFSFVLKFLLFSLTLKGNSFAILLSFQYSPFSSSLQNCKLYRWFLSFFSHFFFLSDIFFSKIPLPVNSLLVTVVPALGADSQLAAGTAWQYLLFVATVCSGLSAPGPTGYIV